MLNIKAYEVKIGIDTKSVNDTLAIMQLVRKELEAQLAFSIFSNSHLYHFFPSAEFSMSRKKIRELFIANFLQIFDATCVNHCLEGLKVRVFPNEVVRH